VRCGSEVWTLRLCAPTEPEADVDQIALLVVGAVFGLVMFTALVVLVVWMVCRSLTPSQAARPEDGSSPPA
jgi:hypothetical protein